MLAWVLACYGITVILTWSHIMSPIRNFIGMFGTTARHFSTCAMCVSWWVGLCLSVYEQIGPWTLTRWHGHILNAFSASAACWMVHVALKRLGMDNV